MGARKKNGSSAKAVWLLTSESSLFLCDRFLSFLFNFPRQGFFVQPGFPGTRSVDQAGIGLRGPPAFASQGLGLKPPLAVHN